MNEVEPGVASGPAAETAPRRAATESPAPGAPPAGWRPPPLPTTFDAHPDLSPPLGPRTQPDPTSQPNNSTQPSPTGQPSPTSQAGPALQASPVLQLQTDTGRTQPPGAPQWRDTPPPGAQPARGPARPDRRLGWLLAGVVTVGVVVAGVLLVVRGVFPAPPQTTPPQATVPAMPVEVSGGDVGQGVELRAATGIAQVTTTRAEWSYEGELDPEPGLAYLVLDVELTGISGEVPVSAVNTVAVAPDLHRYPLAFGPNAPDLLPGTLLGAGDTIRGSLAYQVPPAATQVLFLGDDGGTIATVEIPGP